MITQIDIDLLLPHEQVESSLVGTLIKDIKETGTITPLLVEAEHLVILDGHHRYRAAQALGYTEVPVHLVDYNDIELSLRRGDISCTKKDVIESAQRGTLFPSKTTCHTFLDS